MNGYTWGPYMYIPWILYLICIVRGSSLIKLGSLFWCKITVIICWDNRCPRCRYLSFSHNAIGPAHLTTLILQLFDILAIWKISIQNRPASLNFGLQNVLWHVLNCIWSDTGLNLRLTCFSSAWSGTSIITREGGGGGVLSSTSSSANDSLVFSGSGTLLSNGSTAGISCAGISISPDNRFTMSSQVTDCSSCCSTIILVIFLWIRPFISTRSNKLQPIGLFPTSDT